MAFTYDPTTDRGKVRLLLSDTDTVTAANQIFTDAEIDGFLSLGDSEVYQAAALGCRSLAASVSRSSVSVKVEMIFAVDRKDQPKHFLKLAEQYEAKANADAYEQVDSFAFSIGLFGGDGSEYVGDPW